MDPLESIRSLKSPQEAQAMGDGLDDGVIDNLLETLLISENQQPATRSNDILGALLEEGASGEAGSRLSLDQLLNQPDLKEKLIHLMKEKFNLPEAMAAVLAEAIMQKVNKRKPARRKTAAKKTRKTSGSSAKKKTSKSTAKKKTTKSSAKKKTSKSTVKKKTSSSTAKKRTSKRPTRSTAVEEIKPE